MVDPRRRALLSVLRQRGPLSRWELHEWTDIRPNTVGSDVTALMDEGIVRERSARSEGRGRPRVPLEIDPDRRRVTGIAIRKNLVASATLSLSGQPIGERQETACTGNTQLLETTVQAVADAAADPATLGIGVSLPGFVDPESGQVLLSAALPSPEPRTSAR